MKWAVFNNVHGSHGNRFQPLKYNEDQLEPISRCKLFSLTATLSAKLQKECMFIRLIQKSKLYGQLSLTEFYTAYICA